MSRPTATTPVCRRPGARTALDLVEAHLPDAATLADVAGISPAVAQEVHPLVVAKLAAEPIEDLRIDLEDGFGDRGDEAEDATVDASLAQLLTAIGEGRATPFHGIRFKSFEAPTRRRGLRTLDRAIGVLADHGSLPTGFVVTLPKVTAVEQVSAMVVACEAIESARGLGAGAIRFEIQVETPQSIVTPDGREAVPLMLAAAAGRCTGLHYGTYDYSASLGISAAQQSMEHPVADHAKAAMQVAAAGTGVRLSDGSTNVVPVGSPEAVVAAWRLHARLVRRSLDRGFYQGWDLHPAQLPTRYRRDVRLLPRGPPGGSHPARRLPAPGRLGVPRRAGHRPGPGVVRGPRPRLRRGHRGRGGGADRVGRRRDPGAGAPAPRLTRPWVVKESPLEAPRTVIL